MKKVTSTLAIILTAVPTLLAILFLSIIMFSAAPEKAIGIPVTVSGTTNASGVYAFNFPNAYTVPPNVQVNVIGADNKFVVTTPTLTASGFTVKVERRNTLLSGLLGNVEILLATTTPVVNANVDVLITAKE